MFEHRTQELLPSRVFIGRMAKSGVVAALIIGVWLAIGTLGYHLLGKLGWVDSILNASMIASGMGPVDPLTSDIAKLFASAYSVFSGVIFLSTVAILFTPLAHRMLHRFHMEGKS